MQEKLEKVRKWNMYHQIGRNSSLPNNKIKVCNPDHKEGDKSEYIQMYQNVSKHI